MKNNYTHILFDLDGTLTDSGEGIVNSVYYSLLKYNIKVADRAELCKFVGPPLAESYQKFFGFSKEESIKAVEYYREYYREKGIFENKVYDGVPKLLKSLSGAGKTLVLATSKPHIFAEKILKHFNLLKYFSYISGAELSGERTKKDEVIKYALKEFPQIPLENIIMVGDREHDIIGANACKIDSAGVLYGYGALEEFKSNNATYIAKDVGDLLTYLL